jgi:hypothetical protein
VTVRRWNGQLISEADYTLTAGKTRSIRIEDPNFNIDVADGFTMLSYPDALGCGVLIEPLTGNPGDAAAARPARQ